MNVTHRPAKMEAPAQISLMATHVTVLILGIKELFVLIVSTNLIVYTKTVFLRHDGVRRFLLILLI